MIRVIWSKQARRTIARLYSKNVEFTKEETAQRKKHLVQFIEDKIIAHWAGARKAIEGEWSGSYVVIAEGYWVFYAYPPDTDVIFIEAVVHSRQMIIRPI